jgi:2-dehydro-3-deoxyphosphogluconate aldolase/(4S)-4-hydroxy-2-oxoglutarate aldolase
MTPVEERLRELGVVPVVSIEDAADAPALGKALAAGGLPVAEVTFRTPAAEDAIRALSDACPDVLIGAGTVLDPVTVDRAAASGASFVVAPGLNPEVVRRCQDIGLPVVPGVATPTEVEQARGLGLRLLKLFPAVPSGGLPMVRALAGPYGDVTFMPTGGITAETLPDWLAQPNVTAVGGTWIAPTADISAGRFADITTRAEAARAVVRLATDRLLEEAR